MQGVETSLQRSPSILSALFKQTLNENDTDSHTQDGDHESLVSNTSGYNKLTGPVSNDQLDVLATEMMQVRDDILHEVNILVKDGLLDFLGALVVRYMND